MEAVTCLLLIALGVLCLFLKRKIYKTAATNIPGPQGWPLVGNATFFMGKYHFRDIITVTKTVASSYDSPLSRLWVGPKLLVIVKEPKYMELLLNHRGLINKDNFIYQPIKAASGNGLFTRGTSEGWHRMRKPALKLLKPKNLLDFQHILCEKIGEVIIPKFDQHVDKETFDFSSCVKLCSVEILLVATLGFDLGAVEKNKYESIRLVDREIDKMFSNFIKGMMGLTVCSPEEWRKKLGHIPCKVMEERKILLEQRELDGIPEEQENYADMLLRFGKEENMTETETFLLLTDYLIAGSDTPSVSIIAALLNLAINQECQAKVVQELTDIFGDSTRHPTEEDLKRMVYLEMCLKEGLRLSGPPAVVRLAEEDIKIDGYVIPRGSGVIFSNEVVQTDPRYWERPEEFYPEHFLPEAVAMRPKGAFLPFASGPKMCPGTKYGYQLMKTVVSTLMRRYHWTTDLKYSDVEYKYLFLREPSKPLVKLTRRKPTEFTS